MKGDSSKRAGEQGYLGEPAGVAQDERERNISKAIRALADAARTLLECETAMAADKGSSVSISRRRAEEALADLGVTWDPVRGWVVELSRSN